MLSVPLPDGSRRVFTRWFRCLAAGSLGSLFDTRNDFSVTSGVTLYHLLLRKQDRGQLSLEYYDTLITGELDSRQADIGVRWRPWENIQFDAGCNFGVSADAPDYQPFVGFVTRF